MQLNSVPILNYHKITAKKDIGITSRHPRDFEKDLRLLHHFGYTSITFEQYFNESVLPSKPVILTFDDGYASVLTDALPIMQKFGFRGVIFMPVNYIGKTNDWDVQFGKKVFRHLDREEIRILSEAGFELGSHGLTHQPLPAMSAGRIKKELAESKHILETITGKSVFSICYPFGRFNIPVLRAARESGYRAGVASMYWKALSNGYSSLALRRFNVYRFDSQHTLREKLCLPWNSLLAYRDRMIQFGSSATILYQRLKKPH